MANAVIMPRQSQEAVTCLISEWHKQVGDVVAAGDILCEIETDKAIFEIQAPTNGKVLAIFFEEGQEVPVLETIAMIGDEGEDISSFRPRTGAVSLNKIAVHEPPTVETGIERKVSTFNPQATPSRPRSVQRRIPEDITAISPRAARLAASHGIQWINLTGTGPQGRIIERDIQNVSSKQLQQQDSIVVYKPIVPNAAGIESSGYPSASALTNRPQHTVRGGTFNVIPIKGIRKLIAERMLRSLQTAAQLTLNRSVEITELLDYRESLKSLPDPHGLNEITLNDLVLYAVARTLPQFPELNAIFTGDMILQYRKAHLGFAVDTPRGLMVPVIRNANTLSLKELSTEAKRLRAACLEGHVAAESLNGGTFTVTNLGGLGIESFTPILNVPQVAILGIGNVNLRPVQESDEVLFKPHLGLSLTINHQGIDGAPAARFLQTLSQALANFKRFLVLDF